LASDGDTAAHGGHPDELHILICSNSFGCTCTDTGTEWSAKVMQIVGFGFAANFRHLAK
jgi:hypothetical protein